MQEQNPFLSLTLPDLAATQNFAKLFAPILKTGDVVAFDGTLGAGKTELCRSIIHALGLADDVPSPTFNLVQVYDPPAEDQTTPTIWHMDLYRLEQPEEIFELGVEEAFDTAVSLIEWPSKMGAYLPVGFLTIRLEVGVETHQRQLSLWGDKVWQARLKGIVPDG